MQRPHFKFKSSWLDAINLISDPAVRAELALAIIDYGINGRKPVCLSEMAQVVMALIMPEIDAANRPRKPRKGADAPTADSSDSPADSNSVDSATLTDTPSTSEPTEAASDSEEHPYMPLLAMSPGGYYTAGATLTPRIIP